MEAQRCGPTLFRAIENTRPRPNRQVSALGFFEGGHPVSRDPVSLFHLRWTHPFRRRADEWSGLDDGDRRDRGFARPRLAARLRRIWERRLFFPSLDRCDTYRARSLELCFSRSTPFDRVWKRPTESVPNSDLGGQGRSRNLRGPFRIRLKRQSAAVPRETHLDFSHAGTASPRFRNCVENSFEFFR